MDLKNFIKNFYVIDGNIEEVIIKSNEKSVFFDIEGAKGNQANTSKGMKVPIKYIMESQESDQLQIKELNIENNFLEITVE